LLNLENNPSQTPHTPAHRNIMITIGNATEKINPKVEKQALRMGGDGKHMGDSYFIISIKKVVT